jgi:hypothetical protein
MKIRTRLSIQFLVIAASILIFFSCSVYFLSANYRKQEFYSRLKDKALTTGRLFIVVDQVDSVLLRIIDKNTVNVLPQEEVVIFNHENREVYCSTDESRRTISLEDLQNIRKESEYGFTDGLFEQKGIVYSGRGEEYVVIASAIDLYGLSKLGISALYSWSVHFSPSG